VVNNEVRGIKPLTSLFIYLVFPASEIARIQEIPYVAKGETEEEVLQNATKHVKEVHGYTDEQLNDPKFLEESKKIIKKT
jgi:predicted small metal-binding protein